MQVFALKTLVCDGAGPRLLLLALLCLAKLHRAFPVGLQLLHVLLAHLLFLHVLLLQMLQHLHLSLGCATRDRSSPRESTAKNPGHRPNVQQRTFELVSELLQFLRLLAFFDLSRQRIAVDLLAAHMV